MPVAFCKVIFSCKLVCKDEVAGPRNVGCPLPISACALFLKRVVAVGEVRLDVDILGLEFFDLFDARRVDLRPDYAGKLFVEC
jgi:hypothetical protein